MLPALRVVHGRVLETDHVHGRDPERDQQIVADDWFCDTPDPVTDIHWWGSFLGWTDPELPALPRAFHIGIWTDVPAGVTDPFSHPGQMPRTRMERAQTQREMLTPAPTVAPQGPAA